MQPTSAPTVAAGEEENSSGMIVLGMVLTVAAAMILATSMNMQQFSLAGPETAPVFKHLSRNKLWVAGLLVYLVAQLLFVAALGLGPFAVISALFTSVLIFDTMIASKLFGSKFSLNHMAGLVVIMLAVIACAVFSPKDQYDVTASAMTDWASDSTGILFLGLMVAIVAQGYHLVHSFERKYPEFPVGRAAVPKGTVLCMRIVYPTILAVFETIGASSLKGVVGMLMTMGTEDGQIKHPAFWITVLAWLTCIINTVVWLRKVYAKYPTAECLPTEIGLVTSFSICSGLLFYKEAKTLADILIMSACAAVIPVGISLMIFGRPRHVIHNGKALVRAVSRELSRDMHHGAEHMHHLYASYRGAGFTFPEAYRALHAKLDKARHKVGHALHAIEHKMEDGLHAIEHRVHAIEHSVEDKVHAIGHGVSSVVRKTSRTFHHHHHHHRDHAAPGVVNAAAEEPGAAGTISTKARGGAARIHPEEGESSGGDGPTPGPAGTT